jgi:hypothetical protein
MRSLTIKYIDDTAKKRGKLPRATLTFKGQISDEEMREIWSWILTGKPQIGRAKNKVTINIL